MQKIALAAVAVLLLVAVSYSVYSLSEVSQNIVENISGETQVAAVIAASTETEFPTPADPAWPVVTLSGSAFPLTVSETDIAAIRIGTAYSSWTALNTALAAVAPVIVQLPPGELGGTIKGGCASIVWRGTVDEVGYPLTGIGGAGFRCELRNDILWTLKNVRVGPTEAQLAVDPLLRFGIGNQINFTHGGRLNIINVKSRNSMDNGITADISEEWISRRTSEVWVYDSEFWGHGSTSGEHNIYVHALKVFAFIRSISRDTHGSHELKADGDSVIVVDSAFAHVTYPGSPGWGSDSAVLNISRSQDIRLARNLVIDNTKGGGSSMQIIARTNANGGFSTKTPPVYDVANETGSVRNGRWASSPGERASATTFNAQVEITANVGATSLQIFRIGPYASSDRSDLSLAENYTVRVYLDDTTVQEFTAKPTSMTSTGSTNTAIFPVPGGLRAGAARINKVALKKVADAWDTPLLNSRFWNQNDPNYWWDQIRDSQGKLDLRKQNLFNTAYLEDTLFVVNNEAIVNVMAVESTWQHVYFAYASGNPEIPVPPLNRPQGPTTAWPNVSGASEWKEPLAGPGYPVNGRNPSGFVTGTSQGSVSDMVWPWPFFVADVGIWKQPGGPPVRQFHVGNDSNIPNDSAFLPDVRWLNGSGALVPVAPDNLDPMPFSSQTTLAGGQSAGTRSLAVAGAAGCAAGQKIMIALPLKAGAPRALHISTVTQASGNTIGLADGLVRDAASGAGVVCFTKAGSRPSTWIFPEQYADGLASIQIPTPIFVPSPNPTPVPIPISTPALPIEGLSITGDFTYTTTCTGPLAEGQSCQIVITFRPVAAGERNGTLSFIDPISHQQKVLRLKGIGHDRQADTSASTADLVGTSGDDALVLLKGMHSVDGGAGYDTLKVNSGGPATSSGANSRATAFTFAKNSDGSYTVTRGTAYTFTMINIEKMTFPQGPALLVSDIQARAPAFSFFAWLWDLKTHIELAFQSLGERLLIAFGGVPRTANVAAVVLSVSSDTVDFVSTDLGSSASKTVTLTLTNVADSPGGAPTPVPAPVFVPAPTNVDAGNSGNISDAPSSSSGTSNTGTSNSVSPGSSSNSSTSSSALAPTFTRNLFRGATGEDVRALQKFLNAEGFSVTVSGQETAFFGPATAAALIRFQEKYRAQILTPNGLASGTGILGPATIAFITKRSVTTPITPAQTTAPATGSNVLLITRSLSWGARGTDVTALQQSLISLGYLASGNATGYFGPLTRAALRQFQCAKNLICSGNEYSTGWGNLGPRTRAALK
ncbi:MAG: peptidoglycan-binding protein [bacterium]|nr:peptidoglycan-binding protein [bacterium]